MHRLKMPKRKPAHATKGEDIHDFEDIENAKGSHKSKKQLDKYFTSQPTKKKKKPWTDEEFEDDLKKYGK